MAMPDSQWYPWNLSFIINVDDFIDVLGLKVFNPDNFCRRNASHFCRETTISFQNYEHYLVQA